MKEDKIIVSELKNDQIKRLSLMCTFSKGFKDVLKREISFQDTSNEDLDIQLLKSIINT